VARLEQCYGDIVPLIHWAKILAEKIILKFLQVLLQREAVRSGFLIHIHTWLWFIVLALTSLLVDSK
jgi:hypothetical protein